MRSQTVGVSGRVECFSGAFDGRVLVVMVVAVSVRDGYTNVW